MKILVINSGSSSIKYKLFDMPAQTLLASGMVEKIGEPEAHIKQEVFQDPDNAIAIVDKKLPVEDHRTGLDLIVKLLLDSKEGAVTSTSDIDAVGHRVVHGGDHFSQPVVVDDMIYSQLEALNYLAPLHNPANLLGIEVARKVFRRTKQVAVFDTAFHQSIPDYAFRFAIPNTYYKDHKLRVYGFHGLSHQYVSREASEYLRKPLDQFNAITIHLGNGCSMTAIKNGKSVDTSMGLTPMGGLMMGTRSGDIDPSVILFLSKKLNLSMEEIDKLLNKESGLKGLTGENDLRNILRRYEEKDPAAILAIEIYVYRIKKYLGAYAAVLGHLDAIVFTAGVGENSTFIRERVCDNLDILGLRLDPTKNSVVGKVIQEIQADEREIKILVVPTNEELEIALQVLRLT